MVGLHEEIMAMADGYRTLVGKQGCYGYGYINPHDPLMTLP